MSDAALAVQIALRARLIADGGLTALIPAGNMIDRNARPVPDPAIILGEDQTVDEGTSVDRTIVRVTSTIHVWKRETSLEGCKRIVGAFERAFRTGGRLVLLDGDFQAIDSRIAGRRYLRDPDGEWSHGIVTIDTLVREAWAAS